MTETPEEFRRRVEDLDAKFYEQVIKRGEPHRSRSFEYEKLAVEYSNRGFQLLTYLNGGALVAIPTALAFFKADVGRADVLLTAGAFVVGLFFGERGRGAMKYTAERPFADPDKAARRLMEHARAFEPVQEGRIYIEHLNAPFLFGDKGTPAEYGAGLERAIALGWLSLHESGTFVRFTQSGADLFA